MMKQLLTVLALTALLSGCAGDPVKPATAISANKAIAAAEAARKKANSVDGEWRDTGKIIKKAKSAAKSKNYAKAVSLANMARGQGEMGYQQAVSQKDLVLPSYLKY